MISDLVKGHVCSHSQTYCVVLVVMEEFSTAVLALCKQYYDQSLFKLSENYNLVTTELRKALLNPKSIYKISNLDKLNRRGEGECQGERGEGRGERVTGHESGVTG